MFRHSINTASFFSVLIAALIFSLSLAGVAAAQGNTSLGTGALQSNTTGSYNTAIGSNALFTEQHHGQLQHRPAEPMRCLTTPPATSTLPAGSMRFLATPRASTTPPADSMRS